MTETSHKEPEHLKVVHEPVHLARLEHRKHGLANVERVPPVMVLDRPIILFDAQSPSADNLNKEKNIKSFQESRYS